MNPLIPRGPYRVIGDAMHPRNKRITSESRPHIAKVYATDITPDLVADALANAFAALPDLIEALEAMTPDEPINQDEMGGCVWCGGTPSRQPYGYATANPKHHDKDCAWIIARAVLAKANGEG